MFLDGFLLKQKTFSDPAKDAKLKGLWINPLQWWECGDKAKHFKASENFYESFKLRNSFLLLQIWVICVHLNRLRGNLIPFNTWNKIFQRNNLILWTVGKPIRSHIITKIQKWKAFTLQTLSAKILVLISAALEMTSNDKKMSFKIV